jgi:hypothetical protein
MDHRTTKQHTFKYTWCTFYGRKDKVLDEAREGESNGLTNNQHSNKQAQPLNHGHVTIKLSTQKCFK